MFSSASYFRSIQCPIEAECSAPNCIFKHTGHVSTQHGNQIQGQDELGIEPPRKRQRLQLDEGDSKKLEAILKASQPNQTVTSKRSTLSSSSVQPKQTKAFVGALLSKKPKDGTSGNLTTNRRSSESTSQHFAAMTSAAASQAKGVAKTKSEDLNPRMLKSPPASHSTRALYLAKIYEAMVALNDKVKKQGTPAQKEALMTESEIVALALDEEEKIARESSAVYANVIKLRLVAYKKMGLESWVASRIQSRLTMTHGPDQRDGSEESELSSAQEVQVLSRLLANQDGLAKFGYVTRVPREAEIDSVAKAVELCEYWEKCDRCDSRFQVFHDRRQDGALTSGGECRHHPRRPILPPKDPSSRGVNVKIHPCCNEPVGSSAGCETIESHVFKISDANRLASVIQFEETPENADAPVDRAVSFDCEMGYTTKGLEVLRVTAVSWPEAELLLDVLIKPLGMVLDLNTRFSGITPEQFADAQPYLPGSPAKPDESGAVKVVESLPAARELFFQLISPQTPLIGHAIENDLNTMRIVHPCIVDTVILFPLRSGLPLRRSLKAATKEFLGQSIQTGGAAGHDSKEDARATGELARVKVKQTWNAMRRKGWSFQGQELRPPSDASQKERESVTDKRMAEHIKRGEAALGTSEGNRADSPGR